MGYPGVPWPPSRFCDSEDKQKAGSSTGESMADQRRVPWSKLAASGKSWERVAGSSWEAGSDSGPQTLGRLKQARPGRSPEVTRGLDQNMSEVSDLMIETET